MDGWCKEAFAHSQRDGMKEDVCRLASAIHIAKMFDI